MISTPTSLDGSLTFSHNINVEVFSFSPAPPAVRQLGGLAVWRLGGFAVGRSSSLAVRRLGGLAIWRFGGSAVWQAVWRFGGSIEMNLLYGEINSK